MSASERVGLALVCEGMGDCLFAQAVIRKLRRSAPYAVELFDVVLNTSMTWATRSWPLPLWQRLADTLRARGLSVAAVGKDVKREIDALEKRSPPLTGVR